MTYLLWGPLWSQICRGLFSPTAKQLGNTTLSVELFTHVLYSYYAVQIKKRWKYIFWDMSYVHANTEFMLDYQETTTKVILQFGICIDIGLMLIMFTHPIRCNNPLQQCSDGCK